MTNKDKIIIPKIKKAVIPVAGLGTRMLPATKAIPMPAIKALIKKSSNIMNVSFL